jgi:hypothetical protein
MSRQKKEFSFVERYAVWFCNEKRCWQCLEPLRLFEATVDHVLPESLLDNDVKRREILSSYGLPRDFNINGYENWLPCHNHCNQRKSSKVPEFKPGNILILDRLRRRESHTERTARSVSLNAGKDNVFKTIFVALEKQTISLRDLDELLDAFVHEPAKFGVSEGVVILDSGYLIRRDQIAREGECRCERAACVGQSGKVYCYFPLSLSPWVINTGLFFKCYDEIIQCPRCSDRHKRGHIGRQDICGQPYLNQQTQSDGS